MTARIAALAEIAHRFNEGKIRAGIRARDDNLSEKLVSLVEAHRAERLQKRAGRADVERNALRAGFLCYPYSRGDRLAHAVAELAAVCAEGVCGDDIRSGEDVIAVYRPDRRRVCEIQRFGDSAGLHAALLQLRAHAAVEDNELIHSVRLPCEIRTNRASSIRRS